MDTSEHQADPALLQNWYRYAAEQAWVVDSYLRLVRAKEFKTREQQRKEFGTSITDFQRLQGMALPRSDSFTKDAYRMAQECNIQNPLVFVNTLLLAKQLSLSSSLSSSDRNQHYQAALDAGEGLDTSSESEEG